MAKHRRDDIDPLGERFMWASDIPDDWILMEHLGHHRYRLIAKAYDVSVPGPVDVEFYNERGFLS